MSYARLRGTLGKAAKADDVRRITRASCLNCTSLVNVVKPRGFANKFACKVHGREIDAAFVCVCHQRAKSTAFVGAQR